MKTYLYLSLLGLAACVDAPTVTRAAPEPLRSEAEAPPNAKPGQCWGRDTTPAIYETVTEQILLQPAEIGENGEMRSPPVYKTETRQAVVRERRDIWFERPCEAAFTPEFIASLQRALAARDFYRGPINGEMTSRTRRAVRAYQKPQGLDSAVLSMAAARKLGLVAIEREETAEET